MAKYVATPVGSGFNTQANLNQNFEDIEDNFQNVLYRDGSTPNQMEADLDMNSNRIINLPSASTPTEPVTYGQWTSGSEVVVFTGTTREEQTATASQTIFTLIQAYTPGSSNLSVYINGVLQHPSAFVETDENTVTFTEGLQAGDKVLFVINERQVDTSAIPASSVTYTSPINGNTSVNSELNYLHSVSVVVVATVAEMKALAGLTDGALVQPKGYYAAGDYEMRRRRWVADSSPPTDNGGSIIVSNDGLGYFQLDTTDVIDAREFGAAESRTAGQNTTSIQAAMNVLTESIGFGMVIIGKDIAWTPTSITWKSNVTLMDASSGEELKYISNGHNVSGAVNEFIFESGYHPGIILDVYNNRTLDTLGGGQVYSNRASYIIRVNGTSKWQIANDINATMTDDLTFYRLNSSFQNMTLTRDSKNIFGQMASGGLWTADYPNNLRGSAVCIENSSGNVSIVWRLNDNSKRKIWTFDTTNDRIEVANTANSAVIWGFDDTGFVRNRRGANVASAGTITPTGMIFHVTGTAAIATINLPHAGWNGTLVLIPDGIFTTTTAGNIALASTAVVSKALHMTYDATTAKWYPSY